MTLPPAGNPDWSELGSYPTSSAAEIDAAYLRSEGLATMVTIHSNLPGQAGSALLWVDHSALNRAGWLLKLPPVTDAELEYLATGELPKSKEQQ